MRFVLLAWLAGSLTCVSTYGWGCDSLIRGLVGAEALSASKEGQVLINLGRGPLVDEAALLQALSSPGGRLRGAALDVFDQEPLPPDHPLWKLPNVLLSPHNAVRTTSTHSLTHPTCVRWPACLPACRGTDRSLACLPVCWLVCGCVCC